MFSLFYLAALNFSLKSYFSIRQWKGPLVHYLAIVQGNLSCSLSVLGLDGMSLLMLDKKCFLYQWAMFLIQSASYFHLFAQKTSNAWPIKGTGSPWESIINVLMYAILPSFLFKSPSSSPVNHNLYLFIWFLSVS